MLGHGNSFCPTPVRGSQKYGTKGGCAAELLAGLELPKDAARTLADLGNMGITNSTWSTYRTAKTMVEKCRMETKEDLSKPFNQRKILIFIDWLVRVCRVKASTVNSYLAGIRQLHIVQGLDPPNLRSSLVTFKWTSNNFFCDNSNSKIVASVHCAMRIRQQR